MGAIETGEKLEKNSHQYLKPGGLRQLRIDIARETGIPHPSSPLTLVKDLNSALNKDTDGIQQITRESWSETRESISLRVADSEQFTELLSEAFAIQPVDEEPIDPLQVEIQKLALNILEKTLPNQEDNWPRYTHNFLYAHLFLDTYQDKTESIDWMKEQIVENMDIYALQYKQSLIKNRNVSKTISGFIEDNTPEYLLEPTPNIDGITSLMRTKKKKEELNKLWFDKYPLGPKQHPSEHMLIIDGIGSTITNYGHNDEPAGETLFTFCPVFWEEEPTDGNGLERIIPEVLPLLFEPEEDIINPLSKWATKALPRDIFFLSASTTTVDAERSESLTATQIRNEHNIKRGRLKSSTRSINSGRFKEDDLEDFAMSVLLHTFLDKTPSDSKEYIERESGTRDKWKELHKKSSIPIIPANGARFSRGPVSKNNFLATYNLNAVTILPSFGEDNRTRDGLMLKLETGIKHKGIPLEITFFLSFKGKIQDKVVIDTGGLPSKSSPLIINEWLGIEMQDLAFNLLGSLKQNSSGNIPLPKPPSKPTDTARKPAVPHWLKLQKGKKPGQKTDKNAQALGINYFDWLAMVRRLTGEPQTNFAIRMGDEEILAGYGATEHTANIFPEA